MQETLESPASPALSPDERTLAALRGGDEAAFAAWIDQHHAALVRFAANYVRDIAAAQEVVQETWIAFIQSLDRFQGRSSLRTWLYRTLLNCARNRKRRDVKSVPFSALGDGTDDGPTVDPSRFLDNGVWAGHWAAAPRSFAQDGEDRLLQSELSAQLTRALSTLPAAQREVITLRDVEGFSGEEVCEVLGITEANQRVLLHRARAGMRATIEAYLEREGAA